MKDESCNFVVCGRATEGFLLGMGCGRPWCFQCGQKLCGRMYNPDTGAMEDPNEDHNHDGEDSICDGPGYCPGGHNSHKEVAHKRTASYNAGDSS